MTQDILRLLDTERKHAGSPSQEGDLVRNILPDGSRCLIVYSFCSAAEIDNVIDREISRAEKHSYTLEWKHYSHDGPSNLKERLIAAGFEPEPVESFMVLTLNVKMLADFNQTKVDIRRIHDLIGLNDVAEISHDIGRSNADEEKERLALILKDNPEHMSVYAAYVDNEPASCGRIYFTKGSPFAELCGGRTKIHQRNQGLYQSLVTARIKEALERNIKYISADALPTSEPILKKKGFEFVTHTQPFIHRHTASIHPPSLRRYG